MKNIGTIIVDERRVQKMKQRLGRATKLIADSAYLPMFRNRQINYTKEFEYSVKLAKKKRDPRKYFAFIWSSKNLSNTVEWLRKLMARARAKLAAERNRHKLLGQKPLSTNVDKLEKLRAMKRAHSLIT